MDDMLECAPGIIQTAAGGSTSGLSGDGGKATNAQLNWPRAMVKYYNKIWVADYFNNRIRLIDTTTNNITTYAGGGSTGDGAILTNAAMCCPNRIMIYGSNLYVGGDDNKVRKLNMVSGIITTIVGGSGGGYLENVLATSALFNGIKDISVDGNYLYLSDMDNNRVRRVSLSTSTITLYAGDGNLAYNGANAAATSISIWCPWGIYLTSSYLYVSAYSGHAIYSISLSTQQATIFAGTGVGGFTSGQATSSQMNGPIGIYTITNKFWFVDNYNHAVRLIKTSNGILTTFAGTGSGGFGGDGGPATAAMLNNPGGIVADVDNVWVCDQSNSRIRIIGFPSVAYIYGDPHFKSSAGIYSITGTVNKIYTILTEPRFNWNCQFVSRRSKINSGTYLGKCGFIVSNHRIIMDPSLAGVTVDNVTLPIDMKQKLDENGHSWVRCLTRKIITISLYSCFEIKLLRVSKAVGIRQFNRERNPNLPKYSFNIKYLWHYDIAIRQISSKCVTHGLFGQSVYFTEKVKPLGPNGEGVIQGHLSDYEVDDLFSSSGLFSMYNARV